MIEFSCLIFTPEAKKYITEYQATVVAYQVTARLRRSEDTASVFSLNNFHSYGSSGFGDVDDVANICHLPHIMYCISLYTGSLNPLQLCKMAITLFISKEHTEVHLSNSPDIAETNLNSLLTLNSLIFPLCNTTSLRCRATTSYFPFHLSSLLS